MKANKEVIRAFLNHTKAENRSLFSNGQVLLTYRTCLAEWDGETLYVNDTKYSVTSGKHRTFLIKEIPDNVKVIYVNDALIGSKSLSKKEPYDPTFRI